MKTPDKIYLDSTKDGILDFWYATPRKEQGITDIEYIRKDALLEWLEQELTQRRQWFERYEDGEDLHACNELTKIIEKINSI